MNKKRLLKLADLLEADAKNKKGIKFSLHGWGEADDAKKIAVDCGTQACAVGLACLSPVFNRSGLVCAPAPLKDGAIEPKFGRRYGWHAVKAFFDLGFDEAKFLFSSFEYPSGLTEKAKGERYVAKRIRNFVAGKVAPSA